MVQDRVANVRGLSVGIVWALGFVGLLDAEFGFHGPEKGLRRRNPHAANGHPIPGPSGHNGTHARAFLLRNIQASGSRGTAGDLHATIPRRVVEPGDAKGDVEIRRFGAPEARSCGRVDGDAGYRRSGAFEPHPSGYQTRETSAETGEGITDLLEMLDYQAELLDLKADFNGPARGIVIEAEMQEGRGPVSRVLVQQGHLKVGDFIVVGRAFGRVRDMTDDRGQSLSEAGPATPLELSGIDLVPDAGDKFYITDTLRRAEEVAMQYRDAERHRQLASKTKVTLDNFAATLQAGNVKDLRVVLKADVQGSIDVLTKSLTKLGNAEVSVRVIHSAVGGINESDILLAEASDAIIIGFHVVASPHARELADGRGVDIRLYRVIYNVTNEITSALEGMLEPEIKEETMGTAEIREIFKIGKLGLIAGCLVTDGLMKRGAKARILRDDVVITDNRAIESLRRVKDDVGEVQTGTECGIRITGFDDLKPGDQIICYNVETVARKLAMEGQPSKQ